ncbi:hypothetical protein T439DRAFT_321291 [Meredithblackwellia eburnea MCA 4105]
MATVAPATQELPAAAPAAEAPGAGGVAFNFPFAPPPIPEEHFREQVVPTARRGSLWDSRRGSLWDMAKDAGKATLNGVTKVADTVGTTITATKSGKTTADSFYPTSLDLECAKAARILRTFTMDAVELNEQASRDPKKQKQMIIKKIPPQAIENCQGLAIFTIMRTGFLMSGAGGSGIVVARLPDGTWSGPSGILLHTLGFGIVSGADVYDVVLLLRTTKAVHMFTKPRVSLGGEMSISSGPGPNSSILETGAELSPIWSYVKSNGVFGGIQLDGNIVIERNDENERAYGQRIQAIEILEGDVDPPYWADGLHQTILAAEGKDYDAMLIPQGISPSSSLPLPEPVVQTRRLPQEDLDDEDLAARKEMEEAMRSFGIEDVSINNMNRAEDPHLIRGPASSNGGSPHDGGEDTPPLSSSSSPGLPSSSSAGSRNSSVVYPLSLDGNGDSTTTTTGPSVASTPQALSLYGIPPKAPSPAPPALPPRKVAVVSSFNGEGVDPRSRHVVQVKASDDSLTKTNVLSKDFESPPPTEGGEGMSRQPSATEKADEVMVAKDEEMKPITVVSRKSLTTEPEEELTPRVGQESTEAESIDIDSVLDSLLSHDTPTPGKTEEGESEVKKDHEELLAPTEERVAHTPSPEPIVAEEVRRPSTSSIKASQDPDLVAAPPKAANFGAFDSRVAGLFGGGKRPSLTPSTGGGSRRGSADADKAGEPQQEEEVEEAMSPALEDPLSPEADDFDSPRWGFASGGEPATPSEAETDSFEDAQDDQDGEEETVTEAEVVIEEGKKAEE